MKKCNCDILCNICLECGTISGLNIRPVEFTVGLPPIVNGQLVKGGDSSVREIRIAYRGSGNWAICDGRMCLSKKGSWEYETIPSERQSDFIENTRFASIKEAVNFYMNWKQLVLEWAAKKIEEAQDEEVILNVPNSMEEMV